MIIFGKKLENSLWNDYESNIGTATVICLVIINFFLKLIFISSNSVGGDEPFSIYHAQMDIPSIINHLSAGNNPPLYEIILHFWINLYGISELSVRFPSLIFSTLTVYFIYRIGKDFFNYQTALAASLLFTFSNYNLGFAHEARVYSLFTLLTAMSMFYFLKYYTDVQSSKPRNSKYYYFLLAINTFLIYAHYFGFFVILIQTISIFFLEKDRKFLLKKYWTYILLLTVLYIPNLHIIFMRFIDTTANGIWIKPPTGFESIYNMLWKFSNKPITTVVSVAVLMAAAIKLIVQKDLKNISVKSKIILIWFLLPFLLIFIVSYRIPMFLDRYLVFVSPGYYLLTAICSGYIFKGTRYAFIIPIVLVLFYVFTFKSNFDNGRHVKETVKRIKALKDQNTSLLICPQHFVLNFSYYYNPEIFRDVDNLNVYTKMLDTLQKQNVFGIKNIGDVDLQHLNKIIYLDAAADFSYPDNNIIETLKKSYELKGIYKYPEIFTIYEFTKKNNLK